MIAEPFEIELGKRLEALRKAKGKTQEEVAAELGLKSRETVKQWETWDRHIKANDLRKLCEYYDVSADVLLGLPTETNDYDVCEYTGLSMAAIEAIGILREEDGLMNYINRIIVEAGFDLSNGLRRIHDATIEAKKVLPTAGDTSIMPPIKRLKALNDARTSLELSLFSFSESCRRIADQFASYSSSSYSVLKEFGNAYETFLKSGRKEAPNGNEES